MQYKARLEKCLAEAKRAEGLPADADKEILLPKSARRHVFPRLVTASVVVPNVPPTGAFPHNTVVARTYPQVFCLDWFGARCTLSDCGHEETREATVRISLSVMQELPYHCSSGNPQESIAWIVSSSRGCLST